MARVFGRFDPLIGNMCGQMFVPDDVPENYSVESYTLVELVSPVDRAGNWYLTSEGMVEQRYRFPGFDADEIFADGVDVATITDLPDGTLAIIVGPSGREYIEIKDGCLEITCNIPWAITISLSAPHYVNAIYRVTAK